MTPSIWKCWYRTSKQKKYVQTEEYLFLLNEEIWKHPHFPLEIKFSAICRSQCYLIIFNIYYLWACLVMIIAVILLTWSYTTIIQWISYDITQFIFIIQEISQIFNILAACLHLGNIEYTEVGVHTYSVAIREDIYLQHGTSFIFRILVNISNTLLF